MKSFPSRKNNSTFYLKHLPFFSALAVSTSINEKRVHFGALWLICTFLMNRMAAFILMAKNRGASFSGNSSSSSSSSRESQFNLSHHILQTESAVEASRNVSETSAQSVLCSSGRCAEISGQHGSKNEALTSLSHLIKEGTIIILLKLQSEREMEWK